MSWWASICKEKNNKILSIIKLLNVRLLHKMNNCILLLTDREFAIRIVQIAFDEVFDSLNSF